MQLRKIALTIILFNIILFHSFGQTPPAAFADTLIKPPSAKILEMFRQAGMSPKAHQLSPAELRLVNKAFALLPPFSRSVLKSHLQSISFLDDMPNTALTSIVDTINGSRQYSITFRAAILKQDISQWMTEKEMTCYKQDSSGITLNILAGHLDAFVYVLFHESTHVIDGSLGILPTDNGISGTYDPKFAKDFARGIWGARTEIVYRPADTLLLQNNFHRHGNLVPIGEATRMYKELIRSPFVSLYSTSSWHEDLAELFTFYELTQVLHQRVQIHLFNHGKLVEKVEPAISDRVRKRFKLIARIFSLDVRNVTKS